MCSCVAFIEMLGVDSECLRLHATAADYVQKSINIPICNYLLLNNYIDTVPLRMTVFFILVVL